MINRREFLGVTSSLALPASAAPARPNIIFILADDLGNFDLGCYGQKLIRTPNIDRIAAEGMRFNQAYAGGTVCAPSRSCLMTGRHTGHTTVRANKSMRTGDRVPLNAGDITVARVLKDSGYATGIFGKWGLGEPETTGLPNRHGFDEWFGFLNQDHAVDYYTDHLWRNERKEFLKGNLNGGKKEYTTDLFTREAKSFVRRHERHPFFLYLAYTAPHKDLMVPRDEWYSRQDWPEEDKLYAAMTTWMDRGIGEVMSLLKELKIDDNTIVFFSSDNGAGHKRGIPRFHSTGPFRGAKGDVWEGGIRAPMLARWPGRIKAGAVSEHPWAFWDFLPTAAELAGAVAPMKIDGLSAVAALSGKKQTPHEFLYWENHGKRFEQATRMGDWKAIRQGLDGKVALYDLASDIGETTDLALENPGVVKRAEELLRTVRTDAPEYPTDAGPKRKQAGKS